VTASADEAARLVAAGNDLEDRGLLDAAQEHYLRAIAAAPQAPRPWLNLGNVLARQGRAADAIAAVQSALAIAPDFAPAHLQPRAAVSRERAAR
jgi:tetratricopeptide (TPR) repeat protein